MSGLLRVLLVIGFGAASVACGGSGGSGVPPDGGAPDAGDMAIASPTMPTPPAPPREVTWSWECPSGWTSSERAPGITTCLPPLGDETDPCDGATMRFPGDSRCVPIGGACPASRFGDAVPGERAVYVDASAEAAGADGTLAHPFATTTAALAAASLGSTLVLARGTYTQSVTLPAGVSLRGVCAAEVHLAPSAPSDVAVLVSGADSAVESLWIASPASGVIVAVGASARLRGLRIDAATHSAITVRAGAHLDAMDLAVRGGAAVPERLASALTVERGGVASVARASFEARQRPACVVDGASATLTLEDALLTSAGGLDSDTLGARFLHGADVTLRRVVVSGAVNVGLGAYGRGTRFVAQDVVVRDMRSAMFGGGVGLLAVDGATATLSRVWTVRAASQGLLVAGVGASAEVDDGVFESTARGPTGTGGYGIAATEGASLHATGAASVASADLGVIVFAPQTSATFEDLVVLDAGAKGMEVSNGASATITRMRMERATGVGLYCARDTAVPPTALVVSDLFLDATVPTDLAARGYGGGIIARRGCDLHITRALLSNLREEGVAATDSPGSVTLEDLTIEGVSRARNGSAAGAYVSSAASTALSRVRVRHAADIGVWLGTDAVVEDLDVRDRHEDAPPPDRSNSALTVYGDFSVSVDRFALDGSYESGAFVDLGASVTMHDVSLRADADDAVETQSASGLFVQRGAQVVVERLSVQGLHGTGATVLSETSACTLRDASFESLEGRTLDGAGGSALHVARAHVTIERMRTHRVRDVGIAVFDAGHVEASHVELVDTRARSCAMDACADNPSGIGLFATGNGVARVSDFIIDYSHLAGVMLADGAQVDLAHGRISHATVGVNVQVAGYDFARLTHDVAFADNERNLDAATLPIPDIGVPSP